MRLFWWRDTGVAVTESAELSHDQRCHEMRNALIGIQLARKQITRALLTAMQAEKEIQAHMERIEAALR